MARRRQNLSWWRRCKLICFLGVLIASTASFCQPRGTKHNFERFFCSVDQDGNGEIEHDEATKYLSQLDGDVNYTVRDAVGELPHFEFSYGGKTICSEEMRDHLQNMLTADRVVNWITHGLQLPQYADVFQRSAINGLDFLSLIENDSWALAEELGVSSSLHRTKITSAIVRQIFGFGAPPGPPREMRCQASTCGGIQLSWEPPTSSGYPPLHKYLVYRWSGAASAWLLLADTKETSFLDNTGLHVGKAYSYRIQAWGGHGPSEWVTISNCTASTSQKAAQYPDSASKNFVASAVGDKSGDLEMHIHELAPAGTEGDDIGSTPWGWICSVNSGIFLLGVLSRQSFFFRMTLAVWVVFKKGLKRISLNIYEAQGSDNVWLRTLARGFVSIYRGWLCVQCKIFLLSRQANAVQSAGDASESCIDKKFLSHSDSFGDAIGYSAADCTLEEMLAAIQKAKFTGSKLDDVVENCISKRSTGADKELEFARSFMKITSNLNKRVHSTGTMQSFYPLEARSVSSPAAMDHFDDTEGSRSSIGNSQKELEVSSQRKRTRHRCNYDGCKNRFDRWYYLTDWRMRFSKHYCRECQRVFCVKHTRISPHGPVGRCGLDSTCVCLSCFKILPLEVQERLERINKLRVGPAVDSETSHGSGDDPFPTDFAGKASSLYLNQDPSSSGSLSSRSSCSSKGSLEDAALVKEDLSNIQPCRQLAW